MLIVGKPVEEVPTPALLPDLDKMDWNIEKMMGFAGEEPLGRLYDMLVWWYVRAERPFDELDWP